MKSDQTSSGGTLHGLDYRHSRSLARARLMLNDGAERACVCRFNTCSCVLVAHQWLPQEPVREHFSQPKRCTLAPSHPTNSKRVSGYGCGAGFTPDPATMEFCLGTGVSKISISHDPDTAVQGADYIYTDVWVRARSFRPIPHREGVLSARDWLLSTFRHCVAFAFRGPPHGSWFSTH